MKARYNPLESSCVADPPTPAPKKGQSKPRRSARGGTLARGAATGRLASGAATAEAAAALERATTQASLANYPTIISGFMAKGIPESEIKPRENVFTFKAWRALGRIVRKGEHGVKIGTMIPVGDPAESVDPETGEVVAEAPRTRPWTTTVFHISQTDPIASQETSSRTSSPTSSNKMKPALTPSPNIVPIEFTAPATPSVATAPTRPGWRERYAQRKGASPILAETAGQPSVDADSNPTFTA